jgi:hypothetical protein
MPVQTGFSIPGDISLNESIAEKIDPGDKKCNYENEPQDKNEESFFKMLPRRFD